VKDSVAKLRLESRWRHKIDLVADELAKLTLQPDEFKETNRSAELDQQIHVATHSTFVAGERTEEGQTGNAESIQQRAAITQCRQDVIASDECLCGHPDHSSSPTRPLTTFPDAICMLTF
jgi:hypothetical protein